MTASKTSLLFLTALMVTPSALAGFCLNGPGTHNQDTDRDGFVDCEDNCPLQPNDQTDSDDNGIGDDCDCGITVPPGDANALRVAILTAPPDCAMAVPAGTYSSTSVLTFEDGVSVLGAGAASTIIERVSFNTVARIQQQSGDIFIGGVTLTGGTTGLSAGPTIAPGTVTLSDVIVSGNSPGGGIIVHGGFVEKGLGAASIDLNNSVVTANSVSGVGASIGGGIRVDSARGASGARLRARHSSITQNEAKYGGGVLVDGSILGPFFSGQAELTGCTIEGNHALQGPGGGLATILLAVVTIRDSTIAGNEASEGGGGIYNDGLGVDSASVMTLIDTTVSGNLSNTSGGGIYNGGYVGAELHMTNVTISGNTAALDGGGLYNDEAADPANPGARLSCQNCTITDNMAATGGGIAVNPVNPGQAEFGNSVIAGNLAVSDLDCSGVLLSSGYNLIENTDGCTLTGDPTGNVFGVDAQLGPLSDNGGPTLTHRPGPPLIDAANPLPPGDQGLPLCPLQDQRGVPRPVGNGCDIGAVEEECPPGVQPEAVEGVQVEKIFADVARLSWLPAVGANGGYSITRGLISELAVGQYGSCLAVDLPQTEYDDREALPSGAGFGYLIQAVSVDCGSGTLGLGPGGAERSNHDPLGCP